MKYCINNYTQKISWHYLKFIEKYYKISMEYKFMDKNMENKFMKALMYLDRNKIDITKNILNEILEI